MKKEKIYLEKVSFSKGLRNSSKSIQKNNIAKALKNNRIIKNFGIKFFTLFISLLLAAIPAYADLWTASQPSHGTLFADTITSKTDINAVTVADSQGFIVTTGNVGIGTPGPSAKLDVLGNVRLGPGNANSYYSDGWTAAAGFRNWLIGTTYFDGTNFITPSPGSNYVYAISGGSGVGAGGIHFYTAPSTGNTQRTDSPATFNGYIRMAIDNNGNVGIGTTNPTSKLFVANGEIFQDYANGGVTNGASVRITSNVWDGFFIVNSYWNPTLLSDAYARTGGAVMIMGDQTTTATAGDIYFNQAPSGTANTAVPYQTRVTFKQSGNVGIGTTGPSAKLSVVGSGAEITGTARSAILLTSAGALGTTAGNELALASIGFTSTNAESLGIRAYRVSNGIDWTTTAIGLGMDVDNTARAGANLWLSNNGNVGIGTSGPITKLEVVTAAQGVDGISVDNGVNNGVFIKPNSGAGMSNPLVQAGDKAIIFSAGSIGTGNLTIAPWSASNFGIRITNTGNVGIGTSNPTFTLDVNGNGRVTGSFSKGSGTFLIDHPLDPLNKNLQHSFAESPEMLNIYKGHNSTTKGIANNENLQDFQAYSSKAFVRIEMPNWFNALNGKNIDDYEVTVSPYGKCGQLWADKNGLVKNYFEVYGDNDCEFAWVVYGVRHDAFALGHPVIVESEKSAQDKGKCMHKEACDKLENDYTHGQK